MLGLQGCPETEERRMQKPSVLQREREAKESRSEGWGWGAMCGLSGPGLPPQSGPQAGEAHSLQPYSCLRKVKRVRLQPQHALFSLPGALFFQLFTSLITSLPLGLGETFCPGDCLFSHSFLPLFSVRALSKLQECSP